MARTICCNIAKSSEWRAAGAQEKDLNFYNCRHPPLVAKGGAREKSG